MTVPQQRWEELKAIFSNAVALDGPTRAAFLDDACGTDRAMREQVERLLRSHHDAASFLESPAAAAMPIPDEMIGRTIGPYRVEARLGSGGMGDVYRAHDSRLDRPVALKLLSPRFSGDAERLRRFHAEVRAASSLNHPHILVVHDLGEVDGRPFMVTELVEGQTLRERLLAGRLAMRDTIEIATQIASALSAAHGRAIVHRDIKPENIMVRPDGYVKVLDFGLAKLAPASVADDGSVSTLTNPGMVMGTPQYMSPEQARGQEVDFRSDQFSFGVLIYELATGHSPFARGSVVETAAAVITDEPARISQLCPDMPPPLRWAIERCLAKNRADRYSSTSDLDRDLASIHDRISDMRPQVNAGPESNLPAPATPLVGRDADVAAISALLQQEAIRWVTLTGPGGVGKTRLSIQIAAGLSEAFADAVYFVPLASLSDASLVPSAIAEVLGVRVQGGETPLAALKRHLASAAPALVVIDNFEHVADAAAAVAELLDVSRDLTLLVTSRAGLHVAPEHEYQVTALGLPDQGKARGVDVVAASPAVALFVERAQAARADFVLNADNARAIADICTSLDGLPLAIELAAARVKVLPPVALLAHLEGKRLSLAGSARNTPARQQTLRQTIAWGYELLSSAEQRLFRRLSVFAGGWTLESAEAVCDARQDLGVDVFEGIASLVDKSLVRPAEGSGHDARFSMLATLREYGLERLAAAGEADATRQAHAAYCLVLAEEDTSSEAAAQLRWLELCDSELANIRVAIDHLIAVSATEWALRMTAALLPFWQARAHMAEGRDRLTRALRAAEAMPPTEARTRAAFALGTLWATMGEPAKGVAVMRDVLEDFRSRGDRRGMAVALNAIGISSNLYDGPAAAQATFLETLALFRELGDEQAVARTLSNIAGTALELGEIDRAAELYRQVRTTFDRLGDAAGVAWANNLAAQVELARGDREAAVRLHSEALATFRAIGDTWGTGDSLLELAQLASDGGDRAAAHQRLMEAHHVFAEARDIRGLARVLEGFARFAGDIGDAGRALTLAGAAAALRQRLGLPVPPNQRQAFDRALERVRRGPNAQGVGTAWMDGWSMSSDEAVAYALSVPPPTSC